MSSNSLITSGLRATARLLFFSASWLVVAGADPSSWLIGAPTVVYATWASLKLGDREHARPATAISMVGLIRFLPYFALQSLRGGLDVASRVMRPQPKIDPGFERYTVRLRDPSAQVLFLDSISLLPGTLSADLRNGVIDVHALDIGTDLEPELQRLESLVARIFGERLTEMPT